MATVKNTTTYKKVFKVRGHMTAS